MEFYAFVRGCLAWMASVACLFPINVPILFFAYRIREGGAIDEENRMESDELWKRSALGAVALFVMTWVFLFADVVFAGWADMPAGIIHVVLLLAYVAAGAFLLMYFFAYDDYFHGLSLLTLYLAPPIFVLWIADAILGTMSPWKMWLSIFESLLKEVT